MNFMVVALAHMPSSRRRYWTGRKWSANQRDARSWTLEQAQEHASRGAFTPSFVVERELALASPIIWVYLETLE